MQITWCHLYACPKVKLCEILEAVYCDTKDCVECVLVVGKKLPVVKAAQGFISVIS